MEDIKREGGELVPKEEAETLSSKKECEFKESCVNYFKERGCPKNIKQCAFYIFYIIKEV